MTERKTLKEHLNDTINNNIGFKEDIIFLLSTEEYQIYRDKIPNILIWWWLRSPNINRNFAECVETSGSIDYYSICYNFHAVRPALKYSTLKSEIVKSEKNPNRFIFNDFPFIIIDEEKEIAIAEVPIAFRSFDSKNNDYENSKIRKYLKEWIK